MPTKRSVPAVTLPVLDDRDRRWDAKAARARVRRFTDSTDSPSPKYKNAFLYYNPDEEDNFGGYKLPIADIVGDRMVAIPRGIMSAAGVMRGAMGGVDMSDAARRAVTKKINRYYELMSAVFDEEMESPLKEGAGYYETKRLPVEFSFDVKEEEAGAGGFEGYGSIFGNRDLGNDIVVTGAFAKSLKKRKAKGVKMLWQHRTDEPIGVFDKISEDGDGLHVSGRLALGTQRGSEAYELMKMGALDGLSIGYKADPEKQEYDERRRRRLLKEIDLMEISLVTFPMNPKARISAVKGEDWTIREWEGFLRDEGGLSRSESKVGAKALVEALTKQRDVGQTDVESLVGSLRELIGIMQPKDKENSA